jgi:hypothetical protein
MNDGVELLEAGRMESAIEILRVACGIDPTYFGPPFNLGLAYKAARNWECALDSFAAAWMRLDAQVPTDVYASILWNLGICATVSENWLFSRWAWSQLGFELDCKADGPPCIPLGYAWVSLTNDRYLFGERIDPARVQIMAVDQDRESVGVRAIVAHDMERLGSKAFEGRQLSIFRGLAVLPPR